MVLLPDDDAGGREHDEEIARSLHDRVGEVRVVKLWPDGETKRDVIDFYREHATAKEADRALIEIVERTPAYAPAEDASGEEVESDPTVTFAEFVARADEATSEPLIICSHGTLLPAGALVILGANVGHGKTTLTVELVLHAIAGRNYLGLTFPRPLNVLVIENEGPREAFRQKLEARLATGSTAAHPAYGTCPPSGELCGSPTRRFAPDCARSSGGIGSTSSSPTRSPGSASAATALPRRRASSSSG